MTQDRRNLITDVAGLRVGNASDADLRSGVTVLTADAPFTAGVHVMGGAPGTRETDLLAPGHVVEGVDALVLSGGSAFGLDAASGVAEGLRAAGRGFAVGDVRVPIVPAAILFDLQHGDQGWTENPWKALGRAALSNAATEFGIGSAGAGTGATTATFRGGLGSASAVLPDGSTMGALVVVNAIGSAVVEDGPHFWAAPFEMDAEFGGLGPAPDGPDPLHAPTKLAHHANTTIGIVATDACLTKAQCKRLATAAHDGFARALVPSHTAMDGDLIFAAATGARPAPDIAGQVMLGHAAACVMARAVARAVFAAAPGLEGGPPAWQTRFG
jgi:D-aminopeptidase